MYCRVKSEGVEFLVCYSGTGGNATVDGIYLPDSPTNLYDVLSEDVRNDCERAAYNYDDSTRQERLFREGWEADMGRGDERY